MQGAPGDDEMRGIKVTGSFVVPKWHRLLILINSISVKVTQKNYSNCFYPWKTWHSPESSQWKYWERDFSNEDEINCFWCKSSLTGLFLSRRTWRFTRDFTFLDTTFGCRVWRLKKVFSPSLWIFREISKAWHLSLKISVTYFLFNSFREIKAGKDLRLVHVMPL